MKKIWITSLVKDEASLARLINNLKTYGLQTSGHFWIDDIKNMAWSAPFEEISKKDIIAWVIAGSSGDFNIDSVRFGLSLLTLMVTHAKGQAFPIIIVITDSKNMEKDLPTPLGGADIFFLSNPSLAVKMVATINRPHKTIEKDYYFNIHPIPGLGLWFEVGPAEGFEWKGAILGVHGGEVDFHAVGKRGFLPERSVVEYPQKGIKVKMDDYEFNAWAVQNVIDSNASYFARVSGMPGRLIFGPYPTDDNPEMNIMTLY